MTKISPAQIDGFLDRFPGQHRAFLFYGPDHGLANERLRTAAKKIVPDLGDAFGVCDLSVARLKDDPTLLRDEMASVSMMGGARIVLIFEAEDSICASVQDVLDNVPPGENLVLIQAGNLTPRSKLRKLFESNNNAAAIACYVEDEGQLVRQIPKWLMEHNVRIDQDAAQFLASHLTGDRGVVRSEMEKIALYMRGETRPVCLSDVRELVGDAAVLDMEEPIYAAFGGDPQTLDRALMRLFSEGTSPIALLRASMRHLSRLLSVQAQAERGMTISQAMDQLRPPVFFKKKRAFEAQCRIWSQARLTQMLDRLMQTEAQCKQTGMPDQQLCARGMLSLAMMAKKAK